jgi:hypothetical protein
MSDGDARPVRDTSGNWWKHTAVVSGAPIVFVAACFGGRLGTVQRLAPHVSIPPKSLSVASALAAACAGGHLDIARWLAASLGVPAAFSLAVDGGADAGAADANAADAAVGAMVDACAGGHLDVAQWLVASFGGLPFADARSKPTVAQEGEFDWHGVLGPWGAAPRYLGLAMRAARSNSRDTVSAWLSGLTTNENDDADAAAEAADAAADAAEDAAEAAAEAAADAAAAAVRYSKCALCLAKMAAPPTTELPCAAPPTTELPCGAPMIAPCNHCAGCAAGRVASCTPCPACQKRAIGVA